FVPFFFQAEDGIRDFHVTEFRRVLFRSSTLPPPAGTVKLWTAPASPEVPPSERLPESFVPPPLSVVVPASSSLVEPSSSVVQAADRKSVCREGVGIAGIRL